MSEAIGRDIPGASALGAADWLGLAAAPSFALMALSTAILGDGKAAMFCGFAPEPSWLCGMVPMYLLMSLFHSPPWLRLVAGRKMKI